MSVVLAVKTKKDTIVCIHTSSKELTKDVKRILKAKKDGDSSIMHHHQSIRLDELEEINISIL